MYTNSYSSAKIMPYLYLGGGGGGGGGGGKPPMVPPPMITILW